MSLAVASLRHLVSCPHARPRTTFRGPLFCVWYGMPFVTFLGVAAVDLRVVIR